MDSTTRSSDWTDSNHRKLHSYHALLVRQASGSDELRLQMATRQREAELERMKMEQKRRIQEWHAQERQRKEKEMIEKAAATKIFWFMCMCSHRLKFVGYYKHRKSAATVIQKYVRRKLALRAYHMRKKCVTRRKYIVTEIVETERRYVQDLYTLCTEFQRPLLDALVTRTPILCGQDIAVIFGPIEPVLQANLKILMCLDKRIDKWRPSTNVGDIFVDLAPILSCYAGYVNNYNLAIDTLTRCKMESPAFIEFLEQVERKPTVRGLDLTSFLIMPVQRLPRYTLLLQELHKATWADHGDFELVQKAIVAVKQLTMNVDMDKGLVDSMVRVRLLQDSIMHRGPVEKCHEWPLVAPHRRFVAQGPVTELTSVGRHGRRLQLSLLNDMLVIAEDGVSSMWFIASISLSSACILGPDPDYPVSGSFCVSSPFEKYIFAADSSDDKDMWIELINTCIQQTRKKLEPAPRRHRKAVPSIVLPAGYQQVKDSANSADTRESELRQIFKLPEQERLVDSYFCATVPPCTLYIFSSFVCWRSNVLNTEDIAEVDRRGLMLDLRLKSSEIVQITGVVNAEACSLQIRQMVVASSYSPPSTRRISIRQEPAVTFSRHSRRLSQQLPL